MLSFVHRALDLLAGFLSVLSMARFSLGHLCHHPAARDQSNNEEQDDAAHKRNQNAPEV